MWNKPSEITSYASYGYEIAIGYTNSGHAMNAETALNGWKSSPAHNAAIISEGVSENGSYKAIGIGMYKEFAVTWFGEKLDECQDNCVTLANGGLKPIENPQGECEGIEFKWCVAVNVYGSGMTACREIGEKLTYEECLQLSEHGFYPAEKPPINCARV
jgi:hypothetical protein